MNMIVVSTLQTKGNHNDALSFTEAESVVCTLETKSNHNVYYIFK